MDFQMEEDRIFLESDGELLAEITFPMINDFPCINHTYVSEKLRGQGIAEELVKAAAEQLILTQKAFTVTCTYAIMWLKKHEEYTSFWVNK